MHFQKRFNFFVEMLFVHHLLVLSLLAGCYRPAPPLEDGDAMDPAFTKTEEPDGNTKMEGHPVVLKRQVTTSRARTSTTTSVSASTIDVDPVDSTNEDTAKVISLRVTSPNSSLTCSSANLSYSSSSTAVVANTLGVVFEGSWPNCTATVTPVADAFGSTTLTLEINDGTSIASDALLLTVTAVNDAPALSSIADQSMLEDQALSVSINLNDTDSTLVCSSAYLTATSSDQTLFPTSSFSFSGTYPNCQMTMSPALNLNGTALLSLTVSDGLASASRSFQATVSAVNDAPTLVIVSDQSTDYKTVKGVAVSIDDVDSSLTCASSLTATSSDQVVLPNANISISGSAPNCTVSLTPVRGQTGTSSVTLSLTDGVLSAQDTFILTVEPPPVVWAQEAYVKAANAGNDDLFGYSVSLSGDTLAVGAYQEDANQTTITNGTTASTNDSSSSSNYGAAYVYRRSGTSWTQEAYIKAANAGSNEDRFGYSVSLSEDSLAVGAYQEDSNATAITNGTTASSNDSFLESGAVYVYRRTGSQWAQEAFIKAVNNSNNASNFGLVVSIAGDTLAVSATGERSNQSTITNGTTASSDTSLTQAGAVYIYRRSGVLWAQEAYVKAANVSSNLGFGGSVSLFGDTLAVGASQEKSNQTTITNGTSASSDTSLSDVGAAYVYRRSGSLWVQEAYVKASNAEGGDRFGFSLAISGDTLAVGSYQEDSNEIVITNGSSSSSNNSTSNSGAVYVYRRNGTLWAQEAYVKAVNADISDRFGYSISLSGDTLASGAIYERSNQSTITNGATASSDNTSSSGSVYVYRRSGTQWSQEAYVKASNVGSGDQFGVSVSLSGDTLAVGAIYEDSNQTTITNGTGSSSNNSSPGNYGAVYVYRCSGRIFDPHLRIGDKTSSSIKLHWHSNLGDSAQVKIAPASSGTATPPSCTDAGAITLSSGVTNYDYTGLSANTKYGFRVCAVDGALVSEGAVIWDDTNP